MRIAAVAAVIAVSAGGAFAAGVESSPDPRPRVESSPDAGSRVESATHARRRVGSSPDAGFPAVDRAAQRALLERARALVGVREELGRRVVLAPPRPGVRAEHDARRRTITLYVNPLDAPHRVAHDLAHELGHAWDAERLEDADRREYLRIRGAPGAPWWPAAPGDDYASGAGDFAEVFARCHAASPEFRSRLAPIPADACAALPETARRPR